MKSDFNFGLLEYEALSGEQKLAVGLLRRIVKDLERPTPALLEEIEGWLVFDGPLGPAFMDQLLGFAEGTVARNVRAKLDEAIHAC